MYRYAHLYFQYLLATFSPCKPWDQKSDNHCGPGYICSDGICKLASTCLTNRDCKHGFECNPPHCESLNVLNGTVNANSTTTSKIDPQEIYSPQYSSSFTKILIEPCNCYRFIPADGDGKSQAIKSQVIFNKQRVNGSFCSIVSKISTIIFSYNYIIAGMSHYHKIQ